MMGMRPNLSFERLAIVLALTGCSKAAPAAETRVRSDPAVSASAVTQPVGQASCGAGSCTAEMKKK